ncbi:phosphopantothenate--cysteine ligase [Streptococcus suis]|uniref:Phosphopantothenate--cysteine ligase n=1 Tax=Streptococcus suivaginalis TaxID=3028082 RepID=A0AA96VH13_9STRE|nr:phosphopantothenate--cysteine ligase [Streptococcus sp. 29896]MCK4027629.1 phosphopantothenate--cysteine ligase [Streptococcus suis]WNY48053.1 phosphopantothenate--cysteine ligase [Streptococcus sp. 29896]
MKILITSGGTSEAIDRVRSITNHATGHLGKIVAETFLKAGHQVTLVTTKTAVKPSPTSGLVIHEITNVDSLKTCLEELVPQHQVLIHSMAVSDYTPVYMTGLEEAEQAEHLSDLLTRSNTETKISSKDDYQVLFLKKTPKVISLVKDWNPAIQLIGFKLLVDVSKDQLFAVARQSLDKNKADYIVANDLLEIGPNYHHAYLVSKDDAVLAKTKEEIAELILTSVQKGE